MQAPAEIKSHDAVSASAMPSQSPVPGIAARRPPLAWIAAGLVALAGVAAASFYVGRGAERQEAPPAAPLAAEKEDVATPPKANAAPPAVAAKQSAAACAQCGVVESVQTVQRKGDGSGVGAVAGGVLGGVLGSQVGRGDGRTAMTVLGAIGGGLAGNEVEKRAKATNVYRVRVRTESGELQTFEQSTAWTVGQRVRIDGRQLHPQS